VILLLAHSGFSGHLLVLVTACFLQVLSSESAFVRLARGQYTLRALAGDLPFASPLGQGQGGAASGGAAARRASQVWQASAALVLVV
jgi:hypothetical protein